MSAPLTNLSEIRRLSEKYGFSFSKKLGQNFLINPSVCPKIAENGIIEGGGVIEIGTGFGTLTRELAERAEKVVAVELDTRLLPVLSETLEDFGNVKIINADFLKTDLQALIDTEFADFDDITVCANLPYYVTTPILMKILESRTLIKRITVMVQKEAADRLTASPGTRESGAITYAVRYFSEPKTLFSVSRGSFYPPPNVDSAVISLDILDKSPVEVTDEKTLFSLIKAAFSQRRKTFVNAAASGLSLDKEYLTEILRKIGIDEKIRPEKLTLADFAAISIYFSEN
ncbi:MAG: 16S rRNA (adenine(1518)-N(6)/adenine(1519)-N(6))-dimethyltransferase RsmA [Ruminococcus sp.]|nr:16S rRNA (adenine(1518)-N(6)/adenine(1519)-N(6))-dimethyltransferase RsmA [Ruminococcus sp.]